MNGLDSNHNGNNLLTQVRINGLYIVYMPSYKPATSIKREPGYFQPETQPTIDPPSLRVTGSQEPEFTSRGE